MDYLQDFSDERNKSSCIHCGSWIGGIESNQDHVPSKCLLKKPYPPNLPVVAVCSTCNSSFSRDEEYLALFLQCVLTGSSDPRVQQDSRVGRALQRHEKLRARIERSRYEVMVDGEARTIWKTEDERVNNVILKNARGHAYFEIGEPMLTEPEYVRAVPLEILTTKQRAEFEDMGVSNLQGWPEVGSRMMQRVVTGQDLCNGWVVVQDGIYRYGVVQQGVMLVRSVLWDYLATEVHWSDY